jgi:hypothetical protein
MFDLEQLSEGDVAGRVKMKPSAWGKDIRTGVYKENTPLETRQTMQDLKDVMDIINQFFPTQSMPNQIASIDRAIDSQVAAVQQGSNRRQQKAARLLDESVFKFLRFAMYYNIIQYQIDGEEVTDYFTGAPIQVSLDDLRNTDLPFIIGQGLKSIDRQFTAKSLQQVIFALIQAPQAQQGINLLSMINFWTSMIDIDIDMNQFAAQPPPPVQAPGVAPAQDNTTGGATPPGAAAPPAGGAPIIPMVSPNALTSPIRKTGA